MVSELTENKKRMLQFETGALSKAEVEVILDAGMHLYETQFSLIFKVPSGCCRKYRILKRLTNVPDSE